MTTFSIDLSITVPSLTPWPPPPVGVAGTISPSKITMEFDDDLVLTCIPEANVSEVKITAVIFRHMEPTSVSPIGFVFAWTASDSPPWQSMTSLAPSPGPWPWPDPFPMAGFLTADVPSASDAEVSQLIFSNVLQTIEPPIFDFDLTMVVWGTAVTGSGTFAWFFDPELTCQSGTDGPGWLVVHRLPPTHPT